MRYGGGKKGCEDGRERSRRKEGRTYEVENGECIEDMKEGWEGEKPTIVNPECSRHCYFLTVNTNVANTRVEKTIGILDVE